MKILVTTPAGKTGRRVLRELLAPEFTVRVIARDPKRLPEEIREQVEFLCGSTDDRSTLRSALDGVEALFWCVPTESEQERDVRGHYERFSRAASEAIRRAGTPRVVTISAIGKGLARHAGAISALHAAEDILNQSGAAIRHVRCAPLMENFLLEAAPIRWEQRISYPISGQVLLPMVAASDIADISLRWLVRRDWKDIKAVAAHGPEDISFERAAAIISAALERPVRYEPALAEHYIQRLIRAGASAEYACNQVDMFSELAQGITRSEPRTPESTTLTTLSTWAQGELVPLVEALQEPPKGGTPNKSLQAASPHYSDISFRLAASENPGP